MEWYHKHLGFNTPVVDDAGVAKLMLPYTAGKPQKRHAVMAYNLQGGGGLEIWQYVDRTPSPPRYPAERLETVHDKGQDEQYLRDERLLGQKRSHRLG